jgi:hypothetical protein
MARVSVIGPVGHHIPFSPCPDACQYLIDSKLKKRLDETNFKADSRNALSQQCLLIIQRQPVKDEAIGAIGNKKKSSSAFYLHGSGRVRQHPISRFRETL